MSADPNANQRFESSQVKSFASLDNAINPDARAANTPAVLRAENQDAKSLTKENIEKDLSSEYGNEFDVQQPYGDEFDVEGTEVLTLEKIEHKAQPENSEGGSSSSTEGEGDDKPLRPGGRAPGQAKAEPNTYINADKESKKSGLTRRDGTTLPGTSGSSAGDLTKIFCNVTIEYAKDQNVTYSNTTGGGTKGKESAEALGNSLNETSESLAEDNISGKQVEPDSLTLEEYKAMTPEQQEAWRQAKMKDAFDRGLVAPVTTKDGLTAYVAAPLQSDFQGLIDGLESEGYQINTMYGYYPRPTVSGRSWSKHSNGMALDINPAANGYFSRSSTGGLTITDMPSNTSAIASANNLGWGGNWTNYTDAMHFSAATGERGKYSWGNNPDVYQ